MSPLTQGGACPYEQLVSIIGFHWPPTSNALLTAALDDALAGRGQMVMVAGEPGVGKTRIAQELATHAATLGGHVLWGWCWR